MDSYISELQEIFGSQISPEDFSKPFLKSNPIAEASGRAKNSCAPDELLRVKMIEEVEMIEKRAKELNKRGLRSYLLDSPISPHPDGLIPLPIPLLLSPEIDSLLRIFRHIVTELDMTLRSEAKASSELANDVSSKVSELENLLEKSQREFDEAQASLQEAQRVQEKTAAELLTCRAQSESHSKSLGRVIDDFEKAKDKLDESAKKYPKFWQYKVHWRAMHSARDVLDDVIQKYRR